MGIRYDKDSHKATNGPMIFFSILKDETFEEEIRNAFISGLSFYAYRFPHDTMFSYGSSEGYIEGIGIPGFAIGMFDPNLPFLTIPYNGIKLSQQSDSLYTMPDKSTSFEEYSREVEKIIKDLKENQGSKVVAARVEVRERSIDIAEKFYELNSLFPENFVFCFSTPATGCWIGASPELLLESKEETLNSMALAGTRPAGSNSQWDEKNIKEQEIVTEYILNLFNKHNLSSEVEETYTKKTGNIEHICTPIRGRIADMQDFNLAALLKELSPTPALCGMPKKFALEEIRNLEHFDRGCYGGFCGPFHSLQDFIFHVIIRCASINEKRYCIYAGGGITSCSTVKSEWEESSLKIKNSSI